MTSRPNDPPSAVTPRSRVGQRRRPAARRGSLYLPALLVGTVVTALALGALAVLQSSARVASLRSDHAQARFAAAAGIDAARARLAATPDWRSTFKDSPVFDDAAFGPGPGRFTVHLTSPYNVLTRRDTDPVIVTSVGRYGSAQSTLTATLGPVRVSPLTCLNADIAVGGTLTFNQATVQGPGRLISANGAILSSITGNNIQADLEATLTIACTGHTGHALSLRPLKTFPAADLFSHYTALASPIHYHLLPGSSGNRNFGRALISPLHNPFGPTNPYGIYVINAGGQALTIGNSRIVGTIIVLNASTVHLTGTLNWEPTRADLPALLVQGNLSWRTDSGNLRESIGGINFNPPGVPYPYSRGPAMSNTSNTDEYPTLVNGLVYCSGNLTLSDFVRLHSVYAALTASISGTVILAREDDRNLTTPPPGFYTYRMGLIDGSYR